MNKIQKIINIVVRVTEQGIDKVNSKLNTLGKNAQNAKTNVDGFSKSTKTAGDSAKEAGDKTSEAGKNINKTGGEARKGGFYMRNFGRNIARATSIVATFSIAVVAVQAALQLLSFLTIDSIRSFIEFESALARVRAVSGATNEEIKELAESAKDLAASTLFTSNEIVKLQEVLSKLGFSTREIIDSQRAIATFAQTTGESLQDSAALVGNALRAFELSASSAIQVTNAFTSAITNSALSQDFLRTSLQLVAPITAQLGISVQETSAALGVLADSGFRASRAGTGLRLALLELAETGESLEDLLIRLKEENISLSEAQELVGVRAAGALLTLINQTERYNEILEETNDQTNALNSSLAILSTTESAFSQLGVAITENISKPLGEAVSEALDLKGLAIDLVARLDQQSATQLLTADLFSRLSESQRERLLNTSLETEERERLIQTYARQLEAEKEINFFQLTRIVGNSELVSKFLEDQIDLIGDQTELLERQDELRKSIALEIDSSLSGLTSEKQIAEELDRLNLSISEKIENRQRAIDTINERIKEIETSEDGISNLNAKILENLKGQLVIAESQLEVYVQQQKVLSGFDPFALSLDRLTTEEQLIIAEGIRVKQLADLRKQLDDETISAEERNKAYVRYNATQDELNKIIQKREDIYGKDEGSARNPIDPLILQEKELRSVEETINRIRELGDAIDEALSKGDLNLANNLRLELGEILLQLQTFSREDLKQFPNVWESIFLQGINEETRRLIEEQSEEVAKLTQKTLNEYLSQEDALQSGFDDLGWFGRILYGISTKRPDETQEEFIERIKEIEQLSKKGAIDIANTANQTAFDATRRRLQGEEALLDARYDYERDRLESLVEANLITQEEYERQREKLAEERVKKENEIDKKRFEAEKARALIDIAINTAVQASQVLKDPIKLAIVLGAGAAQAAIVASQQFVPVQYEEGGWVHGKRHSEGGVPFTVQGRGGYEMEGGEFIVNRISAMKNASLLERINKEGKVKSLASQRHYQDGGIIPNLNDPLETIAKATTETANALRRPMRAYVSERELVRKTNARITTERNSDL